MIMLKGKTIYLRLFEPEDYEKTYIWHNDYEIQRNTCGPIRQVSKAIEKAWVEKMANNNLKDIYLAICLIENDEMIGYYSINNIDHLNRKCHCGGVVIGDKQYRDSVAYQEAGRLAFHYIMNELNMNRVTGSCLRDHIMSRAVMEASFWKLEGIERQAIFKEGRYHDVCHYAILRDEWLDNQKQDDYGDLEQRIAKLVRKLRTDIKNKV